MGDKLFCLYLKKKERFIKKKNAEEQWKARCPSFTLGIERGLYLWICAKLAVLPNPTWAWDVTCAYQAIGAHSFKVFLRERDGCYVKF